jgi:hypothetical protein
MISSRIRQEVAEIKLVDSYIHSVAKDGTPLPCSFPHGAPPPSSPTPAATQALAATPASPPAPRTTSTMSPSATPFFPLGRSKAQRWKDSSPSMVGLEGPPSPPLHPSYRDVVASRPVLVERSPPPAKSKPSSCRVLTSVVGHCSISLPKTKDDGWHKVENRHARRRRLLESRALRRRFPEDLLGKCSNCLSVNHRVASCRRPTYCFRCFEPGHRSYACPWRLATSRLQRPPPGSSGWFGARPRWLPLLPLELIVGTPRLHGGIPGIDVSGARHLQRTLPPRRCRGEGNRPNLFRRFCQRRGLPMLGSSVSLIVRLPLTRQKLPSVVLSSPLLVELAPWSPLIKCGKLSHRISA